MGTKATLIETVIAIPANTHAEALAAIKKLHDYDERGERKSYTWVGSDEVVNATSLSEALAEWRWKIEFDPEGNVCGWRFTGEKQGSESSLFEALAPFVATGSFVEMAFDGNYTRWEFLEQSVQRSHPQGFDSSRYRDQLAAIKSAILGNEYWNVVFTDRGYLEELYSTADANFRLSLAERLYRLETERLSRAIQDEIIAIEPPFSLGVSCLILTLPKTDLARSILMSELNSTDPIRVGYASIAAGKYGAWAKEALPILQKNVNHPDDYVKKNVDKAIRQIRLDMEQVDFEN